MANYPHGLSRLDLLGSTVQAVPAQVTHGYRNGNTQHRSLYPNIGECSTKIQRVSMVELLFMPSPEALFVEKQSVNAVFCCLMFILEKDDDKD